MASDYGLNFGFRRSDESMATREGRFKTPASGAALLIGTAVEIDPATPGYLKACAANPEGVSGLRGVLVQEESHIDDLFSLRSGHDSYDLGAAKLDQLSVIWAGIGTKFWFRNTPAYARGNRSKAAVHMVLMTGLAVGDRLGWDGTRWAKSDGTTIPHWLTVTALSGSTATDGYVEAVCSF